MAFDRKTFAKNLRVRRAELDITQAELADRSGVTADLIWKYESGSTTPGADKAYAIAEALGCTLDELCGFAVMPGEEE